ncbi:hypothetical protein JCM33374_g2716 [Metschnikowia sp. JCM 33374]|nr:hypothetical protein JCM33374_g2716 [Metschnikowia sp. JCM 33374]
MEIRDYSPIQVHPPTSRTNRILLQRKQSIPLCSLGHITVKKETDDNPVPARKTRGETKIPRSRNTKTPNLQEQTEIYVGVDERTEDSKGRNGNAPRRFPDCNTETQKHKANEALGPKVFLQDALMPQTSTGDSPVSSPQTPSSSEETQASQSIKTADSPLGGNKTSSSSMGQLWTKMAARLNAKRWSLRWI